MKVTHDFVFYGGYLSRLGDLEMCVLYDRRQAGMKIIRDGENRYPNMRLFVINASLTSIL